MRIVADENVDTEIVRWLRSQHHDVLWIAEVAPAAPDSHVMRLTQQESRVLLTADLDFGQMVVRQRQAPAGVILLRFRTQSPLLRVNSLSGHWPSIEARIDGNLIVVSDSRLRIRRIEP